MEIFHLNLAKIFFKDIKSTYFFIITGLLLKFVLLFGNFWHYCTVEFHKRNFTLTSYKKYRNLLSNSYEEK